jgi:hypothetical protein
MSRIISMIIVLAILGWIICLNTARARCVGGSIGDTCIGIPTPSEPPSVLSGTTAACSDITKTSCDCGMTTIDPSKRGAGQIRT